NNEENGARAGCPCFVNLERVVHKILSKNWKLRGLACLADPTEFALEKIFFRYNRYGAGTRFRISRCLFCRIQIRFEHALGWRRFFDLGDKSASLRCL